MNYTLLINNVEFSDYSIFKWEDSIKKIAISFSFECLAEFEVGAQVEFKKENELIFVGIITDVERNKNGIFEHSGFDHGFYFDQNFVVKQFNGIQIDKAIGELCEEFRIETGKIKKTNATVDKFFKGETITQVFSYFHNLLLIKSKDEKDEDKKSTESFYFDCSNKKLNLKTYTYNEDITGELASVFTTKSTNTINNPIITKSIQNLKNHIIMVDGSTYKIVTTKPAKDDNSIAKYGMLQKVLIMDTNEGNDFDKIANWRLKELNATTTTVTLSMLGDYRMRKGVIIPIENETLNLKGNYLIISSEHVIDDTKEMVKILSEKYDKPIPKEPT